MLRKIRAVIYSRSLEFFRDRAALGWNILFPFLVVFVFGFDLNKKILGVLLIKDCVTWLLSINVECSTWFVEWSSKNTVAELITWPIFSKWENTFPLFPVFGWVQDGNTELILLSRYSITTRIVFNGSSSFTYPTISPSFEASLLILLKASSIVFTKFSSSKPFGKS